MWAPDQVVPKHRRRASVVWGLLLALIIGYAIYIIADAYQQRKDPGVSLRLEAERYRYPTVSVCMLGTAGGVGFGCDFENVDCGGSSVGYAVSAAGFIVPEENVSTANENYPDYCIDMRLGNLEEISDDHGLLPLSVQLLIYWPTEPDDHAGWEEERVDEISSSIFMFWSDPDLEDPLGNHNQSTFIGDVPYTRIKEGETQYNFTRTSIMMEMTETVDLNKSSSKIYFAGSVTPKDYWIPAGLGGKSYNWTVGAMFLDIYQPELSHTLRKEVDPLSWTELVGNVGGTWEFLLILWGLLFIATQQEEPKLKGRNFKKSAQKGVRTVQSVATNVASLRTRSTARRSQSQTEEAPAWDTAARTGQAPAPVPAFNPNPDGSAPLPQMAWGSAAQPSGNPAQQQTQRNRFGGALRFGPRRRVGHDSDSSTGSVAIPGVLQPPSTKQPVPMGVPRPPSYRTSVDESAPRDEPPPPGDDGSRSGSRRSRSEWGSAGRDVGVVDFGLMASNGAGSSSEQASAPVVGGLLGALSSSSSRRVIPGPAKRPSRRQL